jgi:DNA-binding CsgD family transcriptional regulator
MTEVAETPTRRVKFPTAGFAARPHHSISAAEEAVMEVSERTRYRVLLIAVLGVVAGGAIIDVVLDAPERLLSFHVVFELGIAALSVGMILYLSMRWRRSERSLRVARERVEQTRVESERWRARANDALAGFSHAIDQQLQAWQLTATEREVAFGLLKGLSHKRIAALTGRSERTVRQHGIAVYQKAGVAGRAELAAFFLARLLPSAPDGSLMPEPSSNLTAQAAAPPRMAK